LRSTAGSCFGRFIGCSSSSKSTNHPFR
jgi:hypothetical protein